MDSTQMDSTTTGSGDASASALNSGCGASQPFRRFGYVAWIHFTSQRIMFSFPSRSFLSAFLLFQVQPMIGRYILPWFGGGPAVWTGCLLFFQACLLAGYAYAHWLGSLSNVRLQAGIHIGLLLASLAFLPLQPNAAVWKPASGADPSAGSYFCSPLQWAALTCCCRQRRRCAALVYDSSNPEKSPWRLYALSNFGSFLALLSYPFVFEPLLRLRTQGSIWSGLYLVFAPLCGFTAWRLRRFSARQYRRVGNRQRALPRRPFCSGSDYPTCGSTLLVATTNQISQDIAVSPFLWVATLAIYLLTFVLAFESDRFYRRTLFAIAAGLFAPDCVRASHRVDRALAAVATAWSI